MAKNSIRLLLNGKKASLPAIRSAVYELRKQGFHIEVRVTWESGDINRFVEDAVRDGIPRIVACGGDGTVNETASALAQIDEGVRPEMAILPLGTANDFATSCNIPSSITEALALALEGYAYPVDMGKANDHYFINVATGGFGTKVTVETPPQLKRFLGGGAYTLTGIAKALQFSPIAGVVRTAELEDSFEMIAGAVCNGRQAGGGQMLAPNAFIDDGLLDVVIIPTFPLYDLDVVINELLNMTTDGQYIRRLQTQWIETVSLGNTEQVNLDGEPYSSESVRFEIIPHAINVVLPGNCQLLQPVH